MSGVNLDRDSARRIGRVVRDVERLIFGSTARGRGRSPQILATVKVVGFTLTEDMDNTTAGEASATIHKTWDAATEAYTGSESGVVKDTCSIFGDATDTSTGLGLLRQGDGREIVDPYNISCP